MISKHSSFWAGIIICLTTILAVASVWHDSPVVDEIPHIGASFSYISLHSYQFNPEHPPLAKDLAGLAMSVLNPTSPDLSIARATNDQWNFGRQLIYNSGNDAKKLVHYAKLPMLLFFIFSALIIFVWTRYLYGGSAGLLATFLFCLSPTIMAHSRFVTTDIPALFGILLATLFFIKYIQHQNKVNFLLASVALGIGLVTKFSTVLLLPYFILIAILWAYIHNHRWHEFWSIFKKIILVFVTAFVLIVGPLYQLNLLNYSETRQRADTENLLAFSQSPLAKLTIWMSDKPILRPYAEYSLGVLMVTNRISNGNRMFFIGHVYEDGLIEYFPIVYSLKEPIPFLILLFISIIAGLWGWRRASFVRLKGWVKENFAQASMFLWLALYWAFSLHSSVDIGIRHLLPVYGFTYILVAGKISSLVKKSRISRTTLIGLSVILLGWYAVENLSIYPYYLTYFNEFAGGAQGGHSYVTDSNLDWGQDLWRLADFVKDNNISKIDLDYFGWADQFYYIGAPFHWIQRGQYLSKLGYLADNPQGGYIAVSETFYRESISASPHEYDWLKDLKPLTTIGNSIIVWHITP